MRKAGSLAGIGLGTAPQNFKMITWQLAAPKWQLCPKHCSGHGKCGNVKKTVGTCECNKEWTDAACSVLAGWPTLTEAAAGQTHMKPVVQAVQALIGYSGIPQAFDGQWNLKTQIGVKTWLKANAKKGFKDTSPIDAKAWEALVV